ncbi:unnamed protein product [Toxocara canis]|uniref:Pecanex-like protein n=1 Tax=Toxocara canis TaxID=6265 RepID=A0A183VCF8_TOXCA|nr:unnamed protein product [Toxocara canis]
MLPDGVSRAQELTEDMSLDLSSDALSEGKKDTEEGNRTPLAEQSDRSFSQPNFSSLSVAETSKLERVSSTNAATKTGIAIPANSSNPSQTSSEKPKFELFPNGDEGSEVTKEAKTGAKGSQKVASVIEDSQPVLDKTPPVPPRSCDSMLLEVYWRKCNGVDLDAPTSAHVYAMNNHGNIKSAVVLDGLYSVSETITSIHSIYWKDDEMEIRRGTWFLAESLQPINPEMADPIEKHHLNVFRLQTIPETPVFSEKESSKKPFTSLGVVLGNPKKYNAQKSYTIILHSWFSCSVHHSCRSCEW